MTREALRWLGAVAAIVIGAVCVFPYAGLAWLEWVTK